MVDYYVNTPWGWREKLRFKLFPSRHCQLPEAPAIYADCLVVNTVVSLSFIDRLRVLWSGKLRVDTKTVTQNVIGDNITSSVAYPTLLVALCLCLPVTPVAAQSTKLDPNLAWSNSTAQKAADITSTITVGATVGIDVWDAWRSGTRGHALRNLVIKDSVVVGSSELTKRLVRRLRPNMADDKSFWSKHTALSSSSTCSKGKVGLLIPATAYFRIASGWHYLTDTLVGAAVGCAMTYALPKN